MDDHGSAAMRDSGEDMHRWATDLWPLNRSLTGSGVRSTLEYLAELLPGLRVHEVPTGYRAFDWIVPDEWNLNEAWIEDMQGRRIVDTADTNLHIVNYSEPFDGVVCRADLLSRLHSLPEQPDAVPYLTSYYRRTWGFCIAYRDLLRLGDGPFRVHIDSSLEPGHLTYADLVLPGQSDSEVLISTYVCHPSMANNELSGPVVTAALARWLTLLENRRYTYRFVFAPETIGAVVYLSRHLPELRDRVIAGWVVTCIGDDRTYSFLPSRLGGTLADRVSLRALRDRGDFVEYTFLDRGSDERQWCSPGADLPVCSVMRTKYGEYPEYHTSLDNLSEVVTPTGLQGGFDILKECISLLEENGQYTVAFPGEPHLMKHNLLRRSNAGDAIDDDFWPILNTLAYLDGDHDLADLCDATGLSWRRIQHIIKVLEPLGIIRSN
jgi:aminopeptidase-like protein